jgi:5,10-methylene-tetrahydrofolate dehydrogenase/Methenyl tetrahydrofolate cyclohydrolase
MTILMKAKEAADQVYQSISTRVEQMKQSGLHPHMATILVEGDPASAYYAQAKRKIAEKLGIAFELHSFQPDVTEAEVLGLIARLNQDPHVHGIMLELPLPKHLSASTIEKAISPVKDVDGVTPDNKLATVTGDEGLYPATPQACIKLLKHYGHTLAGKNVTLVGRGQTVGLPLFHMLQRDNATVTVCHSRTPDIAMHLQHADIAFVAVGRPDVITPDMVHSNLIMIDAGINEIDGGKIAGDVSAEVSSHVAALSPVPGGVGTLTTAILYENLLKAIDLQLAESTLQTTTISWDNSIREFLQEAGSSNPTPGGGSVAALIAALGASMTSMVGNLSTGEKFASIQQQISGVIRTMSDLTELCEELLHADIRSFNQFMDALKLPRNTDEQKNERMNAIQQAAIQAIEVPLRLVEICKAGMVCTYSISESSNKNVISDLGIGAILFEAAAQAAVLTIEINLATLKDLELKQQYSDKLALLISDIKSLKSKTLIVARNRIMN